MKIETQVTLLDRTLVTNLGILLDTVKAEREGGITEAQARAGYNSAMLLEKKVAGAKSTKGWQESGMQDLSRRLREKTKQEKLTNQVESDRVLYSAYKTAIESGRKLSPLAQSEYERLHSVLGGENAV